MKKIIILCISLLCTTLCFGHKLFKYKLDKNGGAHIYVEHPQNKKIKGEFVIPEYVDGHKVVGFKFEYCDGMTSVVFPPHITEIPDFAFNCCTNLTRVVIPNSVTRIGDYAFTHSFGLISITIPNSVVTIGKGAFDKCVSLREIIIPNSVKEIGDAAFRGCENLAKIKLPDEVNKNGEFADLLFYKCAKLSDIEGYNVKIPYWIDSYITEWGLPLLRKTLDKSFNFYATPKLTSYIAEWQKKKPVETNEQWRERVTEENRKKKSEEYILQLKEDFIRQRTSPIFSNDCVLGEYDTDYHVYKLSLPGNKEMFINVPQDEADSFKSHWYTAATITPKYDIVDDQISIMSCSVNNNGKTYESAKTYSGDDLSSLVLSLPPLEINFGDTPSNSTTNKTSPIDNSVDKNIPIVSMTNSNTFAVVVGNENYTKVSKVQFAKNDARSFAEYCKKTLGIPEKNVRGYEDATYGTLVSAVGDIQKIVRAYNGDVNVIFYYAGHGIPDNVSKDAYILPIDADGREMGICYPLSKLYQQLGEMNAKSVTVFLDACFSGATRGEGMLASARGVAIKAKPSAPQGNMVVFSAATDEQTAFPYAEKGHGMFTYFLLKKLRDTKGDVTLGELGEFIKQEVAKHAIVVNGREQTPTINCSQSFSEKWRENKLK